MKEIQTVVIGGGQAGLATSYYLSRQGHDHIVLEQAERPASGWRNRSWDSFTLITPNWAFRIPGIEKEIDDRDGYMPRDQVIKFFEDYINTHNLPIQYDTRVLSVSPAGTNNYLVQTNKETYKTRNVVVAIGYCQHPKIPAFAKNAAPGITQLHSSQYRNPASIPKGAVLIVGSAQSGCQIAEELYHSGKKVFLCTGTAGRAPRRYRGKDIIEWLELTGFFNLTPDQLPPGMGKFDGIPQLTGRDGGHTINLHQFARDGVTLLGHLRDIPGYKASIEPDLHKNLEIIDGFEMNVTAMIDGFIAANNLDAQPEKLPQLKDGYQQPLIEELDLRKEGISTIIWAMGYRFDYSLVKLPVLDKEGYPIQTSGVTRYPGLYFVGIPWMPSEKSGFLVGMAESARYIATYINKTFAHA